MPTLNQLQTRLQMLLPEPYQGSLDDVQPISMGSAGLKFASDGTVAWNEMWASFCDLAMAGGPPHKGTLLEPASQTEILANQGRYRQVTQEICRGITLVTGLEAQPSRTLGWIRVECTNPTMAQWLELAITMENVSVRSHGAVLELPAGPAYRLEREIKNVITTTAKTCHYWLDHTPQPRQQAIAALFTEMHKEHPLLRPDGSTHAEQYEEIAASIHQITGLTTATQTYAGWLGHHCPDTRMAISMMQSLAATNVLARRENATLFVPVNPSIDARGEILAQAIRRIQESLAT